MMRMKFLSISIAALLSLLPGTVSAQSAFSDPVDQAVKGGGAGLVPVSPNVDAGKIQLGSSAQVIVRFRNDATQPVSFDGIDLYPSSTVSSSISSDECSKTPLAAGAQCALILSVKGLQPGSWRTEILVRHTGQSRLVTATVSGTVDKTEDKDVTVATDIEVSPSPIDFGDLQDSRPIIRSVTVRNITSEPIDISQLYIDAPRQSGYTLRSNCSKLLSGQACVASILWSPLVEGPSSGFLVIEHNGPARVTNIAINGEFKPGKTEQANIFPSSSPGKGVLISNQEEIDFGSGINAQSAITVSLVNAGDADIKMNTIRLAGSENGLKLIKAGCTEGKVLAPTEACPLTISWAPTKVGSVIDDIQIYHSGARGVLVLPIRGTATEAISLDSKPIVMPQENFSDNVTDDENEDSDKGKRSGQPVLDGYVVTSLSDKNAIIRGPVGSKIVTDGKPTLIGGFEWQVKVTNMGVRLIGDNNDVMLIFDRSLSGGLTSTGTSGSAAGTK